MAPMVAITELGPVVTGVMWAETALALPFVATRLYCRAAMHQAKLGWDDFFMAVSWLLLVAYSGACTAATQWGFGRHMDELDIPQFAEANKLEIVGQTLLIAAIATSKTSIAVFLLRIAEKMWHKIVLWVSIVTLSIICFLCASLNFFQCDPIRHVWNPTVPAKCWMSVTPLAITTGAYSIVVDMVLAALPWFIVWTLNMPRKERMNIALSLSLGVFAAVCGIIRTYELQGLSAHSDYSYETVSLVLWSASELVITIICANIPLMRPLYKKIRGESQNQSAPSQPSSGHQPYQSSFPKGLRHSRKKASETWTELDDTNMVATLGAEEGRGTTRTTVTSSKIRREDSDESILREYNNRQQNIRVQADVRVAAERF